MDDCFILTLKHRAFTKQCQVHPESTLQQLAQLACRELGLENVLQDTVKFVMSKPKAKVLMPAKEPMLTVQAAGVLETLSTSVSI